MQTIKKTRPGWPGLRPQVWRSGPDQIRHKLYVMASRSKAQAEYRNEGWEMTHDEYIDLWIENDNYKNKGRAPENLCMTRIDPDLDWTKDNVHIISRLEHYQTCNEYKRLKNLLGRPKGSKNKPKD